MNKNKRNILVTGGAGYIGSKISIDLLRKGYQVFVVDNLQTGFKFLLDKKVNFFKLDIRDEKKISHILKKNKINNIIHLAASLSVEESMILPEKYYSNNVEGTFSLIKSAINSNVKNIIFSSTCATYGNLNGKINETFFQNPESIYGKTKYLAENIIINYSKLAKFNFAILRYFNVVGADSEIRTGCSYSGGQLFKNLSKSIINKKYEIDVYGNDYSTPDGSAIRDYIDVNDLSDIHIMCLKNLSKKNSLILNCGYGYGYSVFEVIKKFQEVSGKKIKINIKNRRKGDVAVAISDNKNLIKKINLNLNKIIDLKRSIYTSLLWEERLKKILKK
jgi:UDP-glucose 4-epimerase